MMTEADQTNRDPTMIDRGCMTANDLDTNNRGCMITNGLDTNRGMECINWFSLYVLCIKIILLLGKIINCIGAVDIILKCLINSF